MSRFRFTIRDLLWLMVVVALAVAWWVDNSRIEKAVTKLESDRRIMQQDFEDKLTILDETQKARRLLITDAIRNRYPIPRDR